MNFWRFAAASLAPFISAAAVAAADLPFQSPDGRRAVGAVETRAPITLDGALDEEACRRVEPAAEFIHAEPHEGQAATELTLPLTPKFRFHAHLIR